MVVITGFRVAVLVAPSVRSATVIGHRDGPIGVEGHGARPALASVFRFLICIGKYPEDEM